MKGNGVAAVGYSEIGAATDGRVVTKSLGDVDVLDPNAPFEALSLTKTMVSAVTLQLVDEGRLSRCPGPCRRRDTERGDAAAVAAPASGARVRAVDYRHAPGYSLVAGLTSLEAIELALPASDLSSRHVEYAATNFLVVGLVLEQTTGQRSISFSRRGSSARSG